VKIKINVNAIGTSIESYIEKYLKDKKIPSCFGNMIPPLLLHEMDYDIEDILCVTKNTPPENIDPTVLSKLIVKATGKLPVPSYLSKYALHINGAMKIEQHKKDLAKKYVQKIIRCIDCKYIDTCSKLTLHYISTLKLIERMR